MHSPDLIMWALKEQACGLGLCISNKLPGEASSRRARRPRAPCAPPGATAPGLPEFRPPGLGPSSATARRYRDARPQPGPDVPAGGSPMVPRPRYWRPESQQGLARRALEGERGLRGAAGPFPCAGEPSCLEDQSFQVPGYLVRWS